MWKCPICGKENDTLQCGCGFDGSRDYEALPTFCELGGAIPAKSSRKSKFRMEKEDMLSCNGCGGKSFGYSRKYASFLCLECGRRLRWGELPVRPGEQPKAAPAAAVPQAAPAAFQSKGINGYQDYMTVLEELYRKNGSKGLSRMQIQEFLNKHNLPKRFGISVYDVEQDIRKIMEKNGNRKPINTYQDYMDTLETVYRDSGKYMLNRSEIQDFLNKYDLPKRFGISIYDVEQDLRQIAKKNLGK